MPLNQAPVLSRSPLPRQQPQVGHFIRDLRQLLGYTQEQFSTVLGVSFSTLNRWENARMQPSPLALKQVETVVEQLDAAADARLQAGKTMLLEKYVSH
jgi:putative transcriptional regulator